MKIVLIIQYKIATIMICCLIMIVKLQCLLMIVYRRKFCCTIWTIKHENLHNPWIPMSD